MYDLLKRCSDEDQTNIHSINFLMQRLGLDQYQNKCKLEEFEWNKAIVLEDALYRSQAQGQDVLLVTHGYYPYQREIKTITPVEFLAELTFKDFSNQYVCLDQCVYLDEEIYIQILDKVKLYHHPFNYDVRDKTLSSIHYLVKQYADSCELYKSPIAHYYHADRRKHIINRIKDIQQNSSNIIKDERTIAYILDKLIKK